MWFPLTYLCKRGSNGLSFTSREPLERYHANHHPSVPKLILCHVTATIAPWDAYCVEGIPAAVTALSCWLVPQGAAEKRFIKACLCTSCLSIQASGLHLQSLTWDDCVAGVDKTLLALLIAAPFLRFGFKVGGNGQLHEECSPMAPSTSGLSGAFSMAPTGWTRAVSPN